ncbi:MAG TPA: hypothetical protein ENJ82_13005 [Bacteroidetes bacterium]|nr:hypothetical protein [Bacteroidota bacterium]
MPLNNYTEIPAAATIPGAPIDAFMLRVLRENTAFAETRIKALLASPFSPHGKAFPASASENISISNPITDEHRTFMYNARKITLNNDLTTKAGVPLVWFASEEIHLKGNIDATGKGAQNGKKGNFGGAGGGKKNLAADDCVLPISEIEMAAGGLGSPSIGGIFDEYWASRLFLHLAGATGGGPGAGASASAGNGGGIVVLCAPKITIDSGKDILAKGQNGLAGPGPNGDGGGGGGGGLILLIAHEFSIAGAPSLDVDGGAGGTKQGTGVIGGAGGNGRLLKYQYN